MPVITSPCRKKIFLDVLWRLAGLLLYMSQSLWPAVSDSGLGWRPAQHWLTQAAPLAFLTPRHISGKSPAGYVTTYLCARRSGLPAIVSTALVQCLNSSQDLIDWLNVSIAHSTYHSTISNFNRCISIILTWWWPFHKSFLWTSPVNKFSITGQILSW